MNVSATKSPQQLVHPSVWTTTSLALVVILTGKAMGQQGAEQQMPQAPQAPAVPSMESRPSQTGDSSTALSRPSVSGNLQLNMQQAEGQDGPEGEVPNKPQRDTGRVEVQLNLEMEQEFSPSARLVGRLELSTLRYSEEILINDEEEFAYDLERLYLEFRPSRALRLRAGRQGISDPMEAVIDENLDGLMISFEFGQFEFDVSHTRKDWFDASSFEPEKQVTYNTMASLQFSPTKDTVWMPYVLHRSDDEGQSPVAVTLLGLMGIVEPYDTSLRYWVHGSLQDGKETEDGQTNELGGFAIDAGINWFAPGAWKPTFTFGAAHASGVTKPNRHRQSGLHSNNFALNAKNTFRYLGEVLDPELTNIQVLTLGIGLDVTKDIAADLAMHSYQQVQTSDSLRGTDLEFDPAGTSDNLGTGIDFVLSYEPSKKVQIQGTAGMFMPGDAFDGDPDTAWLTALEIEYSF